MDRVSQDHSPVLITRPKGEPCMIMSPSDHQSMDETAYILSSPENARRLRGGSPSSTPARSAGWWSRRVTREHRLVHRVVGSPPDPVLELLQRRRRC